LTPIATLIVFIVAALMFLMACVLLVGGLVGS
jgi:hypothetical protein